ncbi:MAG: intradiol ring-cleavage dioxygenase [Actinomycetota bacterium]|nr:intradiol ring-cleavage dioxygenase [Actinomycetota bacterium]
MNEEVLASREAVSRRRALALGGSIGLGGMLAAFGMNSVEAATPNPTSVDAQIKALLKGSGTCTTTPELTQGPYWFDVDSIRSDIRDGRPGMPLVLAFKVLDITGCTTAGQGTPIPNSVVEIWHCDAGGAYSGFESGQAGRPGNGSGTMSSGSYSKGDQEASPTDDGTYLRGAQVANADGIVKFTTLHPGWYPGRTVHIHLKVHLNKKSVLTSQVFFNEKVNSAVYATTPYKSRTGRATFNSGDSIFKKSGVVSSAKLNSGYLGAINLGVDV